jgi:uncharacterized membrane-anchored protein
MLVISLATGLSAVPAKWAAAADQIETNSYSDHKLVGGPRDIALGDEALFRLPAGMNFIPRQAAIELLNAYSFGASPNFHGLVVSDQLNGFILLEQHRDGHVSDQVATTWDVDQMLQRLKQATADGNAQRTANGHPPLQLLGWEQAPAYNSTSNQLIYSVTVQSGQDEARINYTGFILGKEGYLKADIVSSLQDLAQSKSAFDQVISGIAYTTGARYSDYVEGRDRAADYAIDRLILGDRAAQGVVSRLVSLVIQNSFIAVVAAALLAACALFARRSRKVPLPLA